MTMRWGYVGLLCLLWVGCGHRSKGDNGGSGLTMTPADAELSVMNGQPASLIYQVMLDGTDVTLKSTFSVDNTGMGTFSGAIFTTLPAAVGKTVVHATVNGQTAATSLTVRATTVIVADGAPANSPSLFGGADDPSRAPEAVYPPEGALVPPNLNQLEFQFKPAGATLFELAIASVALDLRIYFLCHPLSSGCTFSPDGATWKLLGQAGRNGTLTWTLRGSSAQGGGVGKSAAQHLSFPAEEMAGGIYYWAAAAGGIYRYDFGLNGQSGEPFYTPKQAGGGSCVGCHTLSRDGKRIAVGIDAPTPSKMRALDVATRTKLFEVGGFMGGSNYEALSSDGKWLITTEGGGLTLRDTATGKLATAVPAVDNANMPDFSPDGSQVVFSRGDSNCTLGFCMTLSVKNAGLWVTAFTGNGFGAPQSLVTGGNNYYPSFSPDGKFVLFNRSTGDSYDSPSATVMIVSATGGSPIDLASVNTKTGNSWPKWSPFVHHFGTSTILWLTFSSRRNLGLRANSKAQLWMVPVDVETLAQGKDPGYPPFWLPFQDPSTGNHIAQWVAKVERAPCSQIDQSGCMPNEDCVDGMCVPKIQ